MCYLYNIPVIQITHRSVSSPLPVARVLLVPVQTGEGRQAGTKCQFNLAGLTGLISAYPLSQ